MTNANESSRKERIADASRSSFRYFLAILVIVAGSLVNNIIHGRYVECGLSAAAYAIIGLLYDYTAYGNLRLQSVKTAVLWPFRGFQLWSSPTLKCAGSYTFPEGLRRFYPKRKFQRPPATTDESQESG